MRLLPWIRPSKFVQTNQDYEHYTAYSQLLDRNGQWIGIADTKAGVILGLLVAVFPVLVAPALPLVQKLVKALLPGNASIWTLVQAGGFLALLVLFLTAALITLIRVLMTLTPRLTRQRKPGLIFFGDTISQTYSQWQQSMLGLDSHMLAQQVLEQIYTTAYIATLKHKHVRKAIHALSITVCLGLALYVISLIVS